MTKKGSLSWERNTEGIKAAAERKRQEAFARTEEALKRLIKEKKPINFESVAEAADVTRAWLYKQPELRSRIEFLRQQQSPKRVVPSGQQASESSKDAIIQTLRQRIKRLEADNQELRKQIEVAYGLAQVDMTESLEIENRELQKQNSHLMKLLTECRVENDALKKSVLTKKLIDDNKFFD